MESVKETVKIRVCKGGAWERVDEAVSERLEIDANSDFMVTYNSDNDIVEVCDDLEVNEFMEFVVKSSRIVTLCIVESSVNGRQSSNSGSNQQSNFIHATPSVNVYQTEYHATQISQTPIPVFPGSGGFYQNVPSYQQMHGFSENPMYVPGFPGYPMQDPQSDSANRKLKQVVGSPKNKKPNERDLLDDEKLRPFGEKIMGSVFGTPQESFSELPLYCHNLKLKNQGTITHIETDDEDRFEIFFLAIGAVIRTFVLHMRPLIIIDGAHLKGEFLGTMYLAVAMDGLWKKVLVLYVDWLPSIANKLDMIGLEKWARVHFPGMRYNYMTSNSAESVNALSRHSRKLPICMMIDWFIKSLQQWYFEHRQTADEHKHELTPWAEAKLAQRIAKSATWTVRPAANYLYNVVDYYKNATVDLNTRTCSCGQWQLSGLPCGHLIVVMRHLRQSSANQFAFSCFKTSVWRASYNEVIYDVGHPSEWDKPDGS
ncbi:zinc finger, CCHC-type containing protein [Tanacetum coccineum]